MFKRLGKSFFKSKDAERILFSEFKHREGELITGIARRYERGNIIVDLGKADLFYLKRKSFREKTLSLVTVSKLSHESGYDKPRSGNKAFENLPNVSCEAF